MGACVPAQDGGGNGFVGVRFPPLLLGDLLRLFSTKGQGGTDIIAVFRTCRTARSLDPVGFSELSSAAQRKKLCVAMVEQ